VVLAVGFGVLVDLLLLCSFVWVELLGALTLRLGWLAAGTVWGASAIVSMGSCRREPPAAAADLLFREAMSEYLQGSWFEAETKLLGLLRSAPRDVEARLLVATLLRRTRRHAEALDQLDRLERLRDAAKWSREISEERQHIAAATASLKLAEPGPAPDISQSRETRQAA
jgi:hypothetical protein